MLKSLREKLSTPQKIYIFGEKKIPFLVKKKFEIFFFTKIRIFFLPKLEIYLRAENFSWSDLRRGRSSNRDFFDFCHQMYLNTPKLTKKPLANIPECDKPN